MADWLYDLTLLFGVLQVHDEIVWEIPDNIVNDLTLAVEQQGPRATREYGLTVPMEMEYSIGDRWNK